LAQFFEELAKRPYLKNALVIITGDHGYPTGEHGVTTTESGVFEASFRVHRSVLLIQPYLEFRRQK
jgi:phosphoglycerol transferase MdoB-like AlkP superfamily enzyme